MTLFPVVLRIAIINLSRSILTYLPVRLYTPATPDALGKLAAVARVKRLVITHFAGVTPNPASASDYAVQIRKYFAGRVTFANDLDRY